MPARAPTPWQLASGRQLWRLNQLGRLQVVDDAVSMRATEARALIEAELEKLERIAFRA